MRTLMILIVLLFLICQNLQSQWEPCYNGLGCTTVTSIACSDNIVVAGTDGCGIYISEDYGKNWVEASSQFQKSTVPDIKIYGNKIYASIWKKGLYFSPDLGKSWMKIDNDISAQLIFGLEVNENRIVIGADNDIYISTDDGINWNSISSGITGIPVLSLILNGDMLIAGAVNDGIFLTTDIGKNWKKVKDKCAVYSFGKSNGKYFAGIWDNYGVSGLYSSVDDGQTWDLIEEGKGYIYLQAMQGGIIFAGSYNGAVIKSTDAGDSWENINIGYGKGHVNVLSNSNVYLYAGLELGGIYRAKLSDLGITGVDESSTVNNSEIQVYPNPAGEYLTIDVGTGRDLSLPGEKIYICNLIGECVMYVAAETHGRASLQIDVSHLHPGVYFARCGGASQMFVKE